VITRATAQWLAADLAATQGAQACSDLLNNEDVLGDPAIDVAYDRFIEAHHALIRAEVLQL